MSPSCFIHSSTGRHLGCFHILAIVNNATVNIGVLMLFQISVLGFFRFIPRGGIPGSKGRSIFNFLRYLQTAFQWLHQSVFPLVVQKGSLLSTSSPALVVWWFIDDSHSDNVSWYLCGFNFHFSDDSWCWSSFHISIGHLYVLFGEVSIQVLCPFCNWIVCFFGVEFCKIFIHFGH